MTKKNIENYINFLRSNDLNHEVYQSDDINALVEKWGWCQETLSLMAVRCFRGQFGTDQFHEMMEAGLSEYLNLPGNMDYFLLRLCEEIKNEMWHETLDVSELVSQIPNIFEDLDLRYPAKKIRILAKEIASAEKTHQARSQSVRDRVERGWEHVRKEEYTQAEESVRSALSEYPEDAQALYLDTRLYRLISGSVEAGLQRAQNNLKRAAKFDSFGIAALYNLIGCSFEELSRNEEAIQAIEKATKIVPNESMYIANLAEIHWKIGNKQAAIEYAQKAKRLGKKSELIDAILKESVNANLHKNN
ncbi:tetratricopeptide repeat protein [Leptospira borgpetersenii]|nr:tetratricopeptide repeat protein [Leptospira borgpetersenii]